MVKSAISAKYLANPSYVDKIANSSVLPMNYIRENFLPILRASMDYLDQATDIIGDYLSKYGPNLSEDNTNQIQSELENMVDASGISSSKVIPIKNSIYDTSIDNYDLKKIA